jgi:AraC-like DNA-binding protein
MNSNGKGLIEAISGAKVFVDYCRAFNNLTGLPLAFRPVASWKLPYHGRHNENAYCALMASRSSSCAACLQVQQRLSEVATHEPRTITCRSGLSETAVPVRLGEQVIGLLQTGQVFRKPPTAAHFARAVRLAEEWGLEVAPDQLRRAFFQTRILLPKQHEAVVKMLAIFAHHLALVSNQLIVRQEHPVPAMIMKAKEYINAHQTEDLTLSQVAKAVNTSTFYFCKVFKKTTGINFTDYVSRIRIEKAKNLALNPNLRISEIAFEVGFQSLTHFNRVFKKVTGLSPTQYRAQLPSV